MLDNKHYAFSPPAANCKLWRYIDLTKFLSLLEQRKLFFARSDAFDDPYEGALTRAGVAQLRQSLAEGGAPAEAVDWYLQGAERARKEMFMSCWFVSEHESAAMWKLNLQSPEGIAIQTDHDTLTKILDGSPLRVRTTMVKYVDYETETIPHGNFFYPFVHKRLSFAHETELRAIIWSAEDINKAQIPEDSTSVGVDILPDELVKAVYVAPTAQEWFGDLVEQLLRRYSLAVPIVRSRLYDRPTY